MKQLTPQKNQQEPHLKLIKNSKSKKNNIKKIYINTLTPNFQYSNRLGKTVQPNNFCALL